MSSVAEKVVLAIDTATAAVTAGIVRTGAAAGDPPVELAQRITEGARAHAECLTPNIIAVLADSSLVPDDLDAVVVGCGPGPFTGLRVGMATAAAFGHALAIPVYGVCSLDAIGCRTPGEVLVVTDARRREVYWARYRDGVRTDGPGVGAVAGIAVGAVSAVAGSPQHAAMFGRAVIGPEYPSPAGLVSAVADWGEPQPLVPLYLRRPDAKTLAERGVR